MNEVVRGKIPIDLRERVGKWANIIEKNVGLIMYVRKPALDDLVKDMRDFTREDKFSIIFYDDAITEPCPKCDYEHGRVYQWLGRWYFMCINCAHGIPEPVLVDWGKYGKFNEDEKK